VTLEPSGEFRDEREIGGVIVGSSSAGVPLYLRDLVNVDREYQNPPRYLNQYSWADSAGRWHRGRAITLALQMRPGEKIGDFGHATDSALAVLRHRLPPDLILARTSDQPLQVEENIHLLMAVCGRRCPGGADRAHRFWEWRSASGGARIPLTLR
jgi:multidrug efflux pump subunit AcrB